MILVIHNLLSSFVEYDEGEIIVKNKFHSFIIFELLSILNTCKYINKLILIIVRYET